MQSGGFLNTCTVPAAGRLSVSEREREEVLGSRRGTGVGDTGRAPGTILGLKTLVRGAPKESEQHKVQQHKKGRRPLKEED